MQTLRTQHFTRCSMSLILAASICLGVRPTKGLLNLGVFELWVCYLVALLVAYGAFFIGVWVRFAIIATFAIGFAVFCKVYFPEVASVGELLFIFGR
jgi:hypothetical protein